MKFARMKLFLGCASMLAAGVTAMAETAATPVWQAQWIGPATAAPVSLAGASWIWAAEPGVDATRNAPAGRRFFRREIELPGQAPVTAATAMMTADNHFKLFVNGTEIGGGDNWQRPASFDIHAALRPGRNLITVQADNDPAEGAINAAGLIGKIRIERAGQAPLEIATDAAWTGAVAADGADCRAVQVIGPVGSGPWSGLAANAAAKEANLWTCYRKSFTLNAKPKSAVTRIAVDSKYWLWVNGKLVVREGGLKRGPTPNDTFFDELDLAPHLKAGVNTLAVQVWYFGKEGFSHKSSGRNGFLFELTAGNVTVRSDSSWRARLDPAFGETGAPHPNYRLAESNIRFDAGREISGWQVPGFVDSSWPAAVELGQAGCAPWNRLVQRPVPQWKDYGLKPYIKPPALPLLSTGQTVKVRLPYNAQITPWFKIYAKAGQTVKIQMDNYQGGGENNVRAEYVTRAGVQEFENPGWMNGHEVWYDFPAGVKILALAYRESGFDTAFAGTFDCNDEFLNRLRVKALRTLYITMRDTYMDCPDRERALWWGDAVNELGESFYAFDRKSDLLTRKCILDLIAWQRPDGVLFSPIPTGNWDKDLPLQMLASVGRTGFWTYGLYSGDMETLRTVYPGVKRYMQIWDMQPDGLVVHRPGAWAWGDWGDNVDMTLLYNAWYFIALDGMRNMARQFGMREDLPWIEARMNSIEGAFNRTFWNGREYRSPGYGGKTDDRANALAVVAGFAKPEQFPALIEVLKTQRHSSPYMEKYVLEALCLMDQPALAQERMKQRYAKMVDHPHITTLWEGWGIGSEGFGGGTTNHAWSGGPLTIMSQYFAGIAPVTPGFAAYEVRPRLGNLTRAQAGIETPRGRIEVAILRAPEKFTLKLNSPKTATARVCLPVAEFGLKEVRVNGKLVWKDGVAAGSCRGIAPVAAGESVPGHACFTVAPGAWAFEAR